MSIAPLYDIYKVKLSSALVCQVVSLENELGNKTGMDYETITLGSMSQAKK